jgi:transcriptional regulator with AAA-type ATPase domain
MKNVYITWHYTTHGVAYLKHILSRFYLLEELPKQLNFNQLEQDELNEVFSNPIEKGFLFDEIVYLTAPQLAFDKLSSRRFSYKNTILEDELVIKNDLTQVFEDIINNGELCYQLEKEIEFVNHRYPDKKEKFLEVIWRNIHHYPLEEQINWLTNYSNFKEVYRDKFKVVELTADDLRDEQRISHVVNKWAKNYFKNNDIEPIINVSLGSNETQVVWHILAESGQLPNNTRFIKTYDDKRDKPEKRFKQFSIQEIPTNLISSISSEFKIFKYTKSASRALVNKKMVAFLKSGFSILLIGERGIGKSRIAGEAKENLKESETLFSGYLIEASCASFDEDSKAEAELFGYEKGAFTGANERKMGLLEEANNGILFLDEIHHLSPLVQAKLMKALQTDEKNKMSIRRLGNNKEIKVECRLIFATNQSIPELRKLLLPDFYDRIVQHVVNIPSLREIREDREADWIRIWNQLNFKSNTEVPEDPKLIDWIKGLHLFGNFRDLQKIAMYYNAFQNFDAETKGMIKENSPFEYAQKEFEKYHLVDAPKPNENQFQFSFEKNSLEIEAEFKFFLQELAIDKYHSRKEAAIRLGVSEKALNDWKNRKSLLRSNSK